MTYALTVRPRGLRPTGAVWTALRLHRAALRIWAAFVLFTGATLLWMCGPGVSAARQYYAAHCAGTDVCLSGGPLGRYTLATDLVGGALTAVPFLVAVYAGAVLIGRELERGTSAVLWTQSVSPARWLAATLAAPAVLIVAGLTPLTVLNRMAWSGSRGVLTAEWYEDGVFASTGLLPVAYALLGLALGALAALLTRNSVKGPAIAGVGLYAVLTVAGLFRSSLWPTVTDTGTKALNVPAHAQELMHGAVTTGGVRVANNMACVDSDHPSDIQRCMDRSGLTDFWATYHPASHYWPLQLAESAVVLTLAAAATFAAFRLLRRRTA